MPSDTDRLPASNQPDAHPVSTTTPCRKGHGSVDCDTTSLLAARADGKPEPEVKLTDDECDYATASGDSGISCDVSVACTSELMTQAKALTKRNYFSIASLLELPP